MDKKGIERQGETERGREREKRGSLKRQRQAQDSLRPTIQGHRERRKKKARGAVVPAPQHPDLQAHSPTACTLIFL